MAKQIACPTCSELTEWSQNPHRPFCSEKCRLLDLGGWLSENYTIAGQENVTQNNTQTD